MEYSVQIVEMTLIEAADGETAMPAHFLDSRYPTIEHAEIAGAAEVARRAKEGVRVYYNVLDQHGHPV
jgi:hypothetical protein